MTDESPKLDPRLVQLAKIKANRPTKKQLAWQFIQQGMSPEWCAATFEFPIEAMRKAKAEHERRKADKEKSACG